jgi:transcriptional regulator with XRE-family HTH domain
MDVPLGPRVQAHRKARNLGLNEAARLCGIAPQKFADAENGVDSRASTVIAIARGLGLSTDYLLGLADAPVISMLPAIVDPQEGIEARVAALETLLEGLRPGDVLEIQKDAHEALALVQQLRDARSAGRRRPNES